MGGRISRNLRRPFAAPASSAKREARLTKNNIQPKAMCCGGARRGLPLAILPWLALPLGLAAADAAAQGSSDPEIGFEMEVGGATEGQPGNSIDVPITLSRAPASDITIIYTVSGSASSGNDYTVANSGRVEVPSGATRASITVTVIDDTAVETAVETVTLRLRAGRGYDLDDSRTAYTLRIADDDAAEVLASGIVQDGVRANITLREGSGAGGAAEYSLRLGSQPLGDVTVTLTSADDGAVKVNTAAGTPARVATLTFGPDNWRLPQSVRVTAQDDADGGDENVAIRHRVTGYPGAGAVEDVTVEVLDDEPPEVFFGASASRRLENLAGDGAPAPANYEAECLLTPARIELSSASTSLIRLRYRVGGTATHGADYATDINLNPNSLTGTFDVQPGRKCVVIPMTIENDTNAEGGETVVLTLLDPGPGAGGDYTVDSLRNRHTVTIEDNEGGVIVAPVELDLTEGGEAGAYTVRLTRDPGRSVTVVPNTPDPGAVTISGLLIFSGGTAGSWRRPQEIRVSAVEDSDARDETVTISHAIVGYGDALVPDVTVRVADDDAAEASPVVTINAVGPVDEGGVAQFRLTATPAPLANITVHVAVSQRGDYAVDSDQLGTRPVTIGRDGQTTLTVRTVDDLTDEPDGAIAATVVNCPEVNCPVDYTVATPPSNAAEVAVRDNDNPPLPAPVATFRVDSSRASEHAGTHSVDILLDSPPAATVVLNYTVSGTADPDSDYILHNRSAVAAVPGSRSVRIPVTIVDDRVAENDEIVVLTLQPGEGYAIGAPGAHTLTIADNDSLGVTVAPLALDLDEGRTGAYTVVLDTDPGPGARVTVTPSVSDPGAVVISPHSLTFDTRNWDLPQRVNVSGGDDADDRHEAVTITHTVSGYGNGVTADPVAVAVTDDDYREPVVSISGGEAVEEGGLATFTLVSDPPPSEGIVVNVSVVSSGDFARLGQDGSRLVAIGPDGRGVLSVATQDDGVEEAEGSIGAVIGAGNGYSVALPPGHSADVAVSDNDAPPAVSVASFAADESQALEAEAGGAHRVTVDLVPAAETAFALRFTVSGDAAPGDDYTIGGVAADAAAGGLLAGSVAVPLGAASVDIVLEIRGDDSHEPEERVVLALVGGRGYELGAAATHTLSMIDDDRASGLQVQAESTMARLGRSLSEQWLQGVSDRLAARQRASAPVIADDPFQLAIAGRTDWFDPETGWRTRGLALPPARPAPVAAPPPPVRVIGVSSLQETPPGGSGGPAVGAPAPGTGAGEAGGPVDGDGGGRFRNLLRGVFSSSSFLARGPRLAGGSLGFWGQGATATVAGGADSFSMNADMTSTLLGADWTGVWLTMGVMVSHGQGDGSYRAGNVDGELDLTLTGFTPYLGYQWGERTSIWGALSAGGGELSLRPGDSDGADADISTLSLALGGRSELYAGAQGLSLSVLADGLAVSADTGAVAGLPGVEAGASRLRLSLEGAWSRSLPGGGRLRTQLEAGVRGDGGDAEEGFGAEVAGGVSWTSGAGLTVEFAGRALAVHADEAFEQSGSSIFVSWDPSPDTPLGPALSMRQGQGTDTPAGGGAGRLQGSGGLAALGAGGAPDMERMDVELGWGLPWRGGRYVLTPSVSRGRVGADGSETGVGWRLAPGELNGLDISAALRAAWREQSAAHPGLDAVVDGSNPDRTDRTLEMELRVRW